MRSPDSLSPLVTAFLVLACSQPVLGAQEGIRTVGPGSGKLREVVHEKVLTDGLTDTWTLDLAAGEVVHGVVSSEAFDPVLSLVSTADGRVLAEHDGQGSRSEIRLRVPAAGAHAFRVRGFDGRGGGKYTFRLTRYATTPQPAVGSTSGSFPTEGVVHVEVAMEAGQILVPRSTRTGRITGVLVQETGLPVTPTAGGCYEAGSDCLLHVRIEGTSGHPFAFASTLVEDRPVASEESPPVLPPLDQQIPAFGGVRWIHDMAAGQLRELDVALDAEGVDQLFRVRPDEDRARAVDVLFDVRKGGRRRILVSARRDATIELLARNPAGDGCAAGIQIADGVQALGGSLQQRQSLTHDATLTLGRPDAYAIDLRAGDRIGFAVRSEAFDPVLEILRITGSRIARVDDPAPLVSDPTFVWTVDRSARYVVLCGAAGGGGAGAYRLEVHRLAIPVLTTREALTIQVPRNQTVPVALQLEAGAEILLLATARSATPVVRLVDPRGFEIGTWKGGGIASDVLRAFRAERAGRHLLEVRIEDAGPEQVPCTLRAMAAPGAEDGGRR